MLMRVNFKVKLRKRIKNFRLSEKKINIAAPEFGAAERRRKCQFTRWIYIRLLVTELP